MKIITRCAGTVIEQLNDALPAAAANAKLPRVGRVRIDTTVVVANVQRPIDSSLLAKTIGKINRVVGRIKRRQRGAAQPMA